MTPIHQAFNQSTGGLYRAAAAIGKGHDAVPRSVIVKVVCASDAPFGGSRDAKHPNYWKRELLIYRSGLLDDLPGIWAPRCLGIVESDETTASIWLEDVPGAESPWTPARYRLAAQRLGEFNGAYLVGSRPLPTAAGLSRHWLRSLAGHIAPPSETTPAGPRRDRLQRLWAQRASVLEALDGLPQTFSHQDAFSRNLVVDHRRVTAVDWSFAGIAPVGSELAPLLAGSAFFFDAEVSQLRSVDALILDGYLEGLGRTGWRGNPQLIRLGYLATAAIRYGLFPLLGHMADPTVRRHFEDAMGRPAQDIVDQWTAVVEFLLDRTDEVLPHGWALSPRPSA